AARDGFAGLVVADDTPDRTRRGRRMLERRPVDRLDDGLVDAPRFLGLDAGLQVARQDAHRPVLDAGPLDLKAYQAVGADACELEAPVRPGGEWPRLPRDRPGPPAGRVGREVAVAHGLQEGVDVGVGLDVLDPEPRPSDRLAVDVEEAPPDGGVLDEAEGEAGRLVGAAQRNPDGAEAIGPGQHLEAEVVRIDHTEVRRFEGERERAILSASRARGPALALRTVGGKV